MLDLKHRLDAFAIDRMEEHFHGSLALPGEIVMNSSEGRLKESRFGKIVAADNRDLSGHLESLRIQGSQGTQRHVVVGGQDRGEPFGGLGGELRETCCRLVAARGAPVAALARTGLQTSSLDCLCPPLLAVPRCRPASRTTDIGDSSMSQIDQVLGGEPQAMLSINGNAGHVRRDLKQACFDLLEERELNGPTDIPPYGVCFVRF
jgi:hypothetical protein